MPNERNYALAKKIEDSKGRLYSAHLERWPERGEDGDYQLALHVISGPSDVTISAIELTVTYCIRAESFGPKSTGLVTVSEPEGLFRLDVIGPVCLLGSMPPVRSNG